MPRGGGRQADCGPASTRACEHRFQGGTRVTRLGVMSIRTRRRKPGIPELEFVALLGLGLAELACTRARGEASPDIDTEPTTLPGSDSAAPTANGAVPSVLVFSKTAVYRHASIEVGVQALKDLATEADWQLETTEDAAHFSDEGLAGFNVVVFLSTTGDVLDDTQQGAMERFIRAGHGYVGVHAASDTEYDWPWYGKLVGAYFKAHPAIQPAEVHVVDAAHPATNELPALWPREDEWYAFQAQPVTGAHTLLELDETSYSPGDSAMGEHHPIAWYQSVEGGRSFYTAMGHTAASYSDPLFRGHLRGAIAWAAGS
jgi:cytochrome c